MTCILTLSMLLFLVVLLVSSVQTDAPRKPAPGLISYDRAPWKVDPAPIRAATRGEGLAANITYLVPTAAVQPTVWHYTTAKPAGDWFARGFDASAWKDG